MDVDQYKVDSFNWRLLYYGAGIGGVLMGWWFATKKPNEAIKVVTALLYGGVMAKTLAMFVDRPKLTDY